MIRGRPFLLLPALCARSPASPCFFEHRLKPVLREERVEKEFEGLVALGTILRAEAEEDNAA